MIVRNISLADFTAAVEKISVTKYDGNLTVTGRSTGAKNQSCQVRVIPRESGILGARRAPSGARLRAACWHAYRDVIREAFTYNPVAVIVTGMARYDGAAGFEATYPATGQENMGSQVAPITMPELCDCED